MTTPLNLAVTLNVSEFEDSLDKLPGMVIKKIEDINSKISGLAVNIKTNIEGGFGKDISKQTELISKSQENLADRITSVKDALKSVGIDIDEIVHKIQDSFEESSTSIIGYKKNLIAALKEAGGGQLEGMTDEAREIINANKTKTYGKAAPSGTYKELTDKQREAERVSRTSESRLGVIDTALMKILKNAKTVDDAIRAIQQSEFAEALKGFSWEEWEKNTAGVDNFASGLKRLETELKGMGFQVEKTQKITKDTIKTTTDMMEGYGNSLVDYYEEIEKAQTKGDEKAGIKELSNKINIENKHRQEAIAINKQMQKEKERYLQDEILAYKENQTRKEKFLKDEYLAYKENQDRKERLLKDEATAYTINSNLRKKLEKDEILAWQDNTKKERKEREKIEKERLQYAKSHLKYTDFIRQSWDSMRNKELKGIRALRAEWNSWQRALTFTKQTYQDIRNFATSIYEPIIKSGIEFTDRIANLNAALGEQSDQILPNLKRQILSLANELGVLSPTQIAESATILAKRGVNAKDIPDMSRVVIQLTKDFGDAEKAADFLDATMKTFGLDVSKVNEIGDMTAYWLDKSAASGTDLMGVLRTSKGAFDNFNLSLQDIIASTSLLRDVNITGSQVGTTLRTSLARLVKPTQDAKNALRDLHIELSDVNPAYNSLNTILKNFNKAGAGAADQASNMVKVFGVHHYAAMTLLVNKYNEFSDTLVNLEKGSIKLEDRFLKQWDTLAGDKAKQSVQIELFRLKVYEKIEPILRTITQAQTEFIKGLSNTNTLDTLSGIFSDVTKSYINFVTTLKQSIPVLEYIGTAIRSFSYIFTILPTQISKASGYIGSGFSAIIISITGVIATLLIFIKTLGLTQAMLLKTIPTIIKFSQAFLFSPVGVIVALGLISIGIGEVINAYRRAQMAKQDFYTGGETFEQRATDRINILNTAIKDTQKIADNTKNISSYEDAFNILLDKLKEYSKYTKILVDLEPFKKLKKDGVPIGIVYNALVSYTKELINNEQKYLDIAKQITTDKELQKKITEDMLAADAKLKEQQDSMLKAWENFVNQFNKSKLSQWGQILFDVNDWKKRLNEVGLLTQDKINFLLDWSKYQGAKFIDNILGVDEFSKRLDQYNEMLEIVNNVYDIEEERVKRLAEIKQWYDKVFIDDQRKIEKAMEEHYDSIDKKVKENWEKYFESINKNFMSGIEKIKELENSVNEYYNSLMNAELEYRFTAERDWDARKYMLEEEIKEKYKLLVLNNILTQEELNSYAEREAAYQVFLEKNKSVLEFLKGTADIIASGISDVFGRIIDGANATKIKFKNVFQDIARSFAKMITNMITQWLAAQAIFQTAKFLFPGAGFLGGFKSFLGLATGGDFVVNKPTPIMVGEGGQPERVTVTPLTSSYKPAGATMPFGQGYFDNPNTQSSNPNLNYAIEYLTKEVEKLRHDNNVGNAEMIRTFDNKLENLSNRIEGVSESGFYTFTQKSIEKMTGKAAKI